MLRTIKSSTAWIIIAAAAVVLFGGAITCYYFMFPADLSGSDFSTMPLNLTRGWQTYQSSRGYTVKYPKDYRATEIKTTVTAFGPSGYQGPAPLSIDATKTTETLEQIIPAALGNSEIKDCVQTTLNAKPAYECLSLGLVSQYEIISVNNGYQYNLLFNSGNKNTFTESKSALSRNQKQMLSSFKFTTPTATETPATTTTSTPTETATEADWKAYVNNTYGFGLTFTDAWRGYRIKEVDLAGTIKSLYINVPTTDSFYATETDTHFAGCAAPFVIGVMEKSQWTGSQEQTMDFGSKIGEKGDWIFTYSQWQACPTDLCNKTFTDTIKQVIDSFVVL